MCIRDRFYGVPQTNRAPDGKLINALRGFLDTLARRVDERKPRHVAVTTDEDWRPDWRVELIPSYKAHRTAEPVPHALEPQIPVIMDSLDAVGVDVVGLDDYEAEDIIASLATKVQPPIEILSGDRDRFVQRSMGLVVLHELDRLCLRRSGETENYVDSLKDRRVAPVAHRLNVDGHLIETHLRVAGFALHQQHPAGGHAGQECFGRSDFFTWTTRVDRFIDHQFVAPHPGHGSARHVGGAGANPVQD